jgi:transposase
VFLSSSTPTRQFESITRPTYSSWLNQVEIWFSKIQRDVITRGIFTSKTDLSRKLLRYIKQYNKTKPFRWRYKNVDHRIKPDHSTSL